MNKRLPIDGFRFLAILLVMMIHTKLARGGIIGVSWFFGLSGFLLTYLSLQRNTNFLDYKQLLNYFKSRALRLLMAYYVVSILIIVFFPKITRNYEISDLVKGITLIQPLGFNTWFVKPIAIFYLIFPILFLFNKHILRNQIGLIFGVTVFWPLLYHFAMRDTETRLLYLGDPRASLEQITIGMLAAYIYIKMPEIVIHKRIVQLLMIGFFSLMFFMSPIWEYLFSIEFIESVKSWSFNLFNEPFLIAWSFPLHGFLFSLFLLFYLWEKGVFRKIFNNRIFQFLGLYAYEVYLIHTLIFDRFIWRIYHITKSSELGLRVWGFILTLAVSYAIAIPLGIGIKKFVKLFR